MATTPKPTAKSAVAQRLASSRGPVNRLRARRFGLDILIGKAPTLEFYYEAGDPHSHLCAQLLPQIAARLKTELRVRTVPAPDPSTYPEAGRQRGFAMQDAQRIAPAWGLKFPVSARLADAPSMQYAGQQLAGLSEPMAFVAQEAAVAPALFGGGDIPARADADSLLQANAARRKRLGHYLPGMWQFNGEWFWALDRLDILAQRLREQNLLQGDEPLALFDPGKASLPSAQADQKLEFFYSFRSPYSYLAALDMQQLATTLPVEISVRPVLPMAMRGLPVPLEKRLYIVRDVKRRADLLGYPFGRIAAPIGAGAERCLNTFPLAGDTEQQLAFLTSAGRAIWSEGIDVATDAGLRHAAGRAGLDWNVVSTKLDAGIDLDYAEANRQALFDAGLWGVPSFRIGSFATWGQDRLWMVEEILRRN